MPDDNLIRNIFLAATERPEGVRSTYLDEACGGNAKLREAVERLLVAHDKPAGVLKTLAVHLPATGPHMPQLDVGSVLVGRYKLLEEIGVGGMGAVWLAQQTEPMKRLVAVKLIKQGMDSKTVLARFEAERQALALMDHPNIAKVLDAGVASDGRPFFVMELVKGTPITQFCDARRLSPQERLELFVPLCNAVQHAHQKGVIHRDLKPSNVLVGLYDDKPIPKVIDFGVAKAIGQPLTEETVHTGFGTVVGTPQYMSPEQATFNNLDVDTRSDIYSLGVLLYELLAGSPPFSRKELESAGMLEILRVVREEEPPRPSTKLSTADALPTLAAKRNTEPKKLTGILRNELDWIVMKALEKDRSRRYETANGFSADVQRYLSGEPVQAVPPNLGYRLTKFLRKNSGPVKAVLAICVVLILGTVGTLGGLLVAAEKERERKNAELEVERRQFVEEQRLLRNRDTALALLSQTESGLRAGDAKTAHDLFEQTRKRIAEGGSDDLKARLEHCGSELALLSELDGIDNERWILVEGQMRTRLEMSPRLEAVFAGYGINPATTPTSEAAQRINNSLIRERLLTSLELWFVETHRTDLRLILARADPDEFRNEARTKNYTRALFSLAFRGKSAPSSQPVWFAIGHGHDRQVDFEHREQLLLLAYRDRTSCFPLLMELGGLIEGTKQSEPRLAGPSFLRILNDAEVKKSGLRHAGWYRAALTLQPANATVWNNLGIASSNDLIGAIDAFQEAIKLNPASSGAHYNLGKAFDLLGNKPKAIASYKEAIRNNAKFAAAYYNLGLILQQVDDKPGAIANFKQAILLDPKNVQVHYNLGLALSNSGDLPGAINSFKDAIRFDSKFPLPYVSLGNAMRDLDKIPAAVEAHREAIRLDPDLPVAHLNLGVDLYRNGNLLDATVEFKETIRLDPDSALAHYNLGNCLKAAGNLRGAITEHREAIRLNPLSAEAHTNYGIDLYSVSDFPGACTALRAAIKLNPKLALAHLNLGNSLKASGNLSGAITEYKEAAHLDPKSALTHINLGVALLHSGNFGDAVIELKEAVRIDPTFAGTHLNLGACYLSLRNYAEAAACAREAIRLEAKLSHAHALLGEALLQSGDIPAARAAWTEASSLDPKRWGPLLAKLPPLPIAPPPRELKPENRD